MQIFKQRGSKSRTDAYKVHAVRREIDLGDVKLSQALCTRVAVPTHIVYEGAEEEITCRVCLIALARRKAKESECR